MAINQAVVFTKPLHHLGIDLTPEHLGEQVCSFLKKKGFHLCIFRTVSGMELQERGVMDQHYYIYSTAAIAMSMDQVAVSEEGCKLFQAIFGKTWNEEVQSGRILPTAELLSSRRIDSQKLSALWDIEFEAGKAFKLQSGIVLAWLDKLEAYCINGFYSAMVEKFHYPGNTMHYYVVEFDSNDVSWKCFRKNVLGSTNCSAANPESFRGRMYKDWPVANPTADNFVHGSAGPLEGFAERVVHEVDIEPATSPIGAYLQMRGVSPEAFQSWKKALPIIQLAELFDLTEEKNSNEITATLDTINLR